MTDRPPQLTNRGGGWADHSWTTLPHGFHLLRMKSQNHAVAASAVAQVKLLEPKYQNQGPHALRGLGNEPVPGVKQLLDVLRNHLLSIPDVPNVDAALALNWTKIPDDDAPVDEWLNTAAYQLVRDGKYRFSNPRFAAQQQAAGRQLTDLLVNAIDQHPLLYRASGIVIVPGHDTTQPSFGARLGRAVARRRGLPAIEIGTSTEFRVAAKNVSESERARLLRGQFTYDQVLRHQVLLIVDDVLQTGSTMSEIGRILVKAGASQILTLCAARTMRSV